MPCKPVFARHDRRWLASGRSFTTGARPRLSLLRTSKRKPGRHAQLRTADQSQQARAKPAKKENGEPSGGRSSRRCTARPSPGGSFAARPLLHKRPASAMHTSLLGDFDEPVATFALPPSGAKHVCRELSACEMK